MIRVTNYKGAYIVELFSKKQWERLTRVPRNKQEKNAHRRLVNQRYQAFLYIKRLREEA